MSKELDMKSKVCFINRSNATIIEVMNLINNEWHIVKVIKINKSTNDVKVYTNEVICERCNSNMIKDNKHNHWKCEVCKFEVGPNI